MASKNADSKSTVKKLLNVTEHKYSPMQVPVWVGDDCYMVEHQDCRKIEDTRHICYSKFTEKGLVPIDVNNESNSNIVSSITSAANNLYSLEQPISHEKRELLQNKVEQSKIQATKEKPNVSGPKKKDVCQTFHQPKAISGSPRQQSAKGAYAAPTTNPVPIQGMNFSVPMNVAQIPLMLCPDNELQTGYIPHLSTAPFALPNTMPLNTNHMCISDVQNKQDLAKIQIPKDKQANAFATKKRDVCQTFRPPKLISSFSQEHSGKGAYSNPITNPLLNQGINHPPGVNAAQMPLMMNPESGLHNQYGANLPTMPYTTSNAMPLNPAQGFDMPAGSAQNKQPNGQKPTEQNCLTPQPLYSVPQYYCNDPETCILNITHF